MTSQGISDAFRDAESMARAFDEALASYQRSRDTAPVPMFELTCEFANLEEPPPPHMQELLAAIHGNPEATSDFLSTLGGVVSPSEFFAAENVERIKARAVAAA